VSRLRRLFDHAGAFHKARTLIDKSRSLARTLAEQARPEQFRQLLEFLIETVLAEERPRPIQPPGALTPLPLV
jgi:hypothetical protein